MFYYLNGTNLQTSHVTDGLFSLKSEDIPVERKMGK